jgi:two-component system, LytTR family, response regulator
MMNAVIVDDEKNAIGALALLLAEHCSGVRIVGQATSASEAVTLIRETSPDLVFLDIEMPSGTGFQVLEMLPDRAFAVVFVTAYDQYAIKAIKFSALDYLLKPVDRLELVQAVERAEQSRATVASYDRNLRALQENLTSRRLVTLAIPTLDGFEFVKVRNILRIEAAGRCSEVFLADGAKLTVSRNLGEFEKLLDGPDFFRTHHAHLVSLAHLKSYLRQDGGTAVMADGARVPVARSRREGFLARVKPDHR